MDNVTTWGPFSAAQVRPDSALELGSTLADNVAQVLEIVAGCDAKAAHEVLGG
jgi:hypothetical protein